MTKSRMRKEAKRRARNKKRRADYNRRKNARGKTIEHTSPFRGLLWFDPRPGHWKGAA